MTEEIVIRTKDKKHRGKTLEELQKLDVRESAKYLPSRSRRSVLRHFDIIEKFISSCDEKRTVKKKIRTHFRDLVIVPKMVGMTIGVHNGKTFEDVIINIDMIGHRLGEFVLTRKKVTHSAAGIGATKGSKAVKK